MSLSQEKAVNEQARRYWLSLDGRENPESANAQTKGEFLSPPQLELEADRLGLDRRSFLKLMGASAAMVSFAGCARRPVQTIVPYVSKPEEITHGIPNHYASNDPVTGYGLVLTTREGRPIKVDGNEGHPMNGQGLGARGQASIFDLYDPDRLRMPLVNGTPSSLADFDRATAEVVKKSASVTGGLYFLTSTIHSPSLRQAIAKLTPNHYMMDSLPYDDIRDGQKESYGKSVLPVFRFHKAKMIVSIDADFLDTMLSPEEFTRQFAQSRKLGDGAYTRFVAFESTMRLTGQNADVRVPIEPTERLSVALLLAKEVAKRTGKGSAELEAISVASLPKMGIDQKLIEETAEELARNRGRGLVIAGGVGGKGTDALALQNVVNFMNWALGNDGATVDGAGQSSNLYQGAFSDLQKLVLAMDSGLVSTLIIQGVNPVYSLPSSVGFAKALEKVKNIIYVGSFKDETGSKAKYVLSESHAFETWGDVNPLNDLFGIVQPTIRPLFETRSLLDQVLIWGKANAVAMGGESSYELVRSTFRGIHAKYRVAADFETFWETTLQKGFFDGDAGSREQVSSPRNYLLGSLSRAVRAAKEVRPVAENSFSLVLQPSIAIGDGSQSNNAQLHELPDPVTKVTWTNYLSVSPAIAKTMGLKDGDIVRIENSSHSAELPVLRQPGLRDGVISAQIGYGRKFGGRVGDGVGVALSEFVQQLSGGLSFHAPSVKMTKTGRHEELALTQEHHSLEGRDIVFETSYEDYKHNPGSGIVRHVEKLDSMWSGFEYKGHRWGMVIDLNRCTGCSACVLACSVENNIPVVGRDQVRRGREMHWIRVDRYYSGTPENPETIHQPMTCQHCENAPCETVCPVLATVHSSEGLNSMIYNRCVGTRYCANNCPYKVRRFNFFEFNQPMNGKFEHPIALSKNPEVTIRSRGVMEKCSFCVQRIEAGKSTAKREGRPLKDGEVKSACQLACPAEAITFGDMNDPSSQIAKIRKDPRGFEVLEELNTKPALRYLTKVWNRPPEAKDAGKHGGGH